MSDDDLKALYRQHQARMKGPTPAFSAVLKRPAARAQTFRWVMLGAPTAALAALGLVVLTQAGTSDPALPNVGELQVASTDELLMTQAPTAYQRTDLLLPQSAITADGTGNSADLFFTSTDLLLTP